MSADDLHSKTMRVASRRLPNAETVVETLKPLCYFVGLLILLTLLITLELLVRL